MFQIPTPTVKIMEKMGVSVTVRSVGIGSGLYESACDVTDIATGKVFHTARAASEIEAVERAIAEAINVPKPLTPAQAYAMSVGAKAAQAESADKIKSLEDEVAALKAQLVEKSTKKIKPPVDPAQ